MTQPEGYVVVGEQDKLCKLKKGIYELTEAARSWHLKISKTLRERVFNKCASNLCLFKRDKNGNMSYVIVFVDGVLVLGKEKIRSKYMVNYLGNIK